MRRAMAEAEVGDAEYDDDPSVNQLQERAAEVMGTEAAIYLVTGTMCNQIALHVLARAGHEVSCVAGSHIAGVEAPAAALLNALTCRQIPSEDGVVSPEAVVASLEPDPDRGQIVDLVAIENTHSSAGGTPWEIDDVRGVAKVVRDAGLPLYMDASRVFNASAATGTAVAEYAAETHALMFCLSKGLGAPIGSMLCGPADFVAEARATKILFGISWRQAGITAAAGLVALDESPGRLHEDHELARVLAEGIAEATPDAISLDRVRTNILFVDPSALGLSPVELESRLKERGVLVNTAGTRVRFVTHRDVSRDGIDTALAAWRELARG